MASRLGSWKARSSASKGPFESGDIGCVGFRRKAEEMQAGPGEPGALQADPRHQGDRSPDRTGATGVAGEHLFFEDPLFQKADLPQGLVNVRCQCVRGSTGIISQGRRFGKSNTVPVGVSRDQHERRQDCEYGHTPRDKSEFLELEQDVEQSIQYREDAGGRAGQSRAAQHAARVDADEGDHGSRRDAVGDAEPDVLGEREQHQLEDDQRATHHEILDGMNPCPVQDFRHEKAHEGEYNE